LRLLAYFWGIIGVIAFLCTAVYRLSPRIWELADYSLTGLHWTVLVVFTLWMAWAEGYKGFHLAFSPRVVARARYLKTCDRPLLLLLAPAYCIGYFHATRKRMIVSWVLTTTIVMLVLLLRITPQPWRGIIDTGVVTGLGLGILSLVFFWLQDLTGKWNHAIPLDLPESETVEPVVSQAKQP